MHKDAYFSIPEINPRFFFKTAFRLLSIAILGRAENMESGDDPRFTGCTV